MSGPDEKTPLVPEGKLLGNDFVQTQRGLLQTLQRDASSGTDASTRRIRQLHSAPIKSCVSGDMDMDSLRLSYAAKLVLAAVEGRNVESAVDLLLIRGGFANPLGYPSYRFYARNSMEIPMSADIWIDGTFTCTVLVWLILGHLLLALWEGRRSPFPFHPAVAAMELLMFVCYAAHVLVSFWTFGAKHFRDKKWHFVFTVLAACHCVLLAFAVCSAAWYRSDGSSVGHPPPIGGGDDDVAAGLDWWNAPRMAMLWAHALRPLMLISQLQTIRRVFSNVLRTASRTGSIVSLWGVALAFYSVLGTNLFNSAQVKGYSSDGDNFDSFSGAILALFVLTTEENFPDVADPAFSQRPMVAFPFFVSFLLLFLIVILPLMLGIVLDAYGQQHAQQLAQSRRKARNALLAAYYVLDEDGARGVGQEQFVGVLTAEAGVGIDEWQANQLWLTIAPEEDADARGPFRSFSLPVSSTEAASAVAASATVSSSRERRGSADKNATTTAGPSPPLSAAAPAAEARTTRSASAPHRTHRTASKDHRGRVDVHGFLQLADFLHERVVHPGEDGDGEEEEEEDAAAEEAHAVARRGSEEARRARAGVRVGDDDGRSKSGGGRGSGGGAAASAAVDAAALDGDGQGQQHRRCVEPRRVNLLWEPIVKEESQKEGEGRPLGGYDVVGGGIECGAGNVCGTGAGGSSGAGAGGAGSGNAGVLAAVAEWDEGLEEDGSASEAIRRSLKLGRRRVRGLWGTARAAARYAVGREWFARTSQATTVLLTLMALMWTPTSQEKHDLCLGGVGEEVHPKIPACRRQNAIRHAEGLLLLTFLAEMITKVVAVGGRRLWRRHWAHRFDLIVLMTSFVTYLIVGLPGDKAALYIDRHPCLSDVFELPRALIVLRLLTVFPRLRRLLETMAAVSKMLLNIMVLYSCVSFSFAAIGMAIFADAKSDILEARYSFTTLPDALLALFFLTVSNNWNDLLYPLINSVRAGRWSALYFVTYILFCATVMLDVLVGVVIEGFRVSTRGPDQVALDARKLSDDEEDEGTQMLDCVPGDDQSLTEHYRASPSGSALTPSSRSNSSSSKGVPRKASKRKFTEVRAEDVFRAAPKGELSARDKRELEQAVKAVEERLHQAWVSHIQDARPSTDDV